MITHLDGIIEERTPAYIIIDINGIGYWVNISLNTYSSTPNKGRVRLFTHLAIREDAHVLYGFSTQSERTMFRQLISVSGVGAATALLVLSALNPSEVAGAIASADITTLKKIKGIGAKSAERIIVDLKDKVSDFGVSGDFSGQGNNTIRNEALSALSVLGIDKKKAEKVVDSTLSKSGNDVSVEELIKITLKSL